MDMSMQRAGDDASEYEQHGADACVEVGETTYGRTPSVHAYADSHGPKSLAEIGTEWVTRFELDQTSPLVTFDSVDAENNCVGVTFRDREKPGFAYEFWCHGQADALQWVAHLSEKNWVTTRHLEIFARRVADHFPEPRHTAVKVLTNEQVSARYASRGAVPA